MIKRIIDKSTLAPTSPFSHLVMDEHYAYVAGRVAADLPGHEKILGDTRAETQLIMESIKVLLEAQGIAMDQIVRVDVHLIDMEEIGEMDKAYGMFFADGAYPARTCTQSNKLFGGSRVEITCMAKR